MMFIAHTISECQQAFNVCSPDAYVPTDAYQSQVDREAHSFGRQHLVQAFLVRTLSISEQARLPVNATQPFNVTAQFYSLAA
jgi:hypothetical protein